MEKHGIILALNPDVKAFQKMLGLMMLFLAGNEFISGM
jgi:hypothetical protein